MRALDELLAAEVDGRRQHCHVQDTVRLSGILRQSTTMRRRRLQYVRVSMLGTLQRVRPTVRKHPHRRWSQSVRHQ